MLIIEMFKQMVFIIDVEKDKKLTVVKLWASVIDLHY